MRHSSSRVKRTFGAALLLWRYAEAMLFGLKARDPLIIAEAGGLLAVTAICAAFVPAQRAAKVRVSLLFSQRAHRLQGPSKTVMRIVIASNC